MTRQTVIAYWLIPSEPAHSFFQRMINDLARRCDAPVFEPHVTILVGADRADAAKNALAAAARKCKVIGLTPLGIDQSDEFIKTLFVQFAMSAELRKTSDIIREAANDSSQYELKPHLSLLYKNLAVATRRELEHLPKKVSGYHILYLYYLACCGVKLVVAQRLPGA